MGLLFRENQIYLGMVCWLFPTAGASHPLFMGHSMPGD